MKKRIVSIMAVLALMFGPMSIQPVKAQILIMDEEDEAWSDRVDIGEGLEMPIIPELGITLDQYAPLGGEVLALGLLGGAYQLGKRRKEK